MLHRLLAPLIVCLAQPVHAQHLCERSLGVMGTDLVIQALHEESAVAEAAVDAAVAEMRRVEDLMTDWRASPLTTLNEGAGSGPQVVERELFELIERSLLFGELTEGAFDVTYAGAGKLWDFKAEEPRVPSAQELAAALQNVGYARLRVDPAASTVELPRGMRIGLGGIAKGYGVDRAMDVLMEAGIEHAMVSAGGDLKALGTKRGEPWRIAVRHPRQPERVLAALPVSNVCVMTSGDYERFFELDGVRYHHIIDPRTGAPSNGCLSATVIAREAASGDALATAMCVLGPERGLSIIEGLPGVEAILVGMDGEVRMSSGLRSAGSDD